MRTVTARDKMLWERAMRAASLAPGVVHISSDVDQDGEGVISITMVDGGTAVLRRYADVWAFIERPVGGSYGTGAGSSHRRV